MWVVAVRIVSYLYVRRVYVPVKDVSVLRQYVQKWFSPGPLSKIVSKISDTSRILNYSSHSRSFTSASPRTLVSGMFYKTLTSVQRRIHHRVFYRLSTDTTDEHTGTSAEYCVKNFDKNVTARYGKCFRTLFFLKPFWPKALPNFSPLMACNTYDGPVNLGSLMGHTRMYASPH